MRAFYICESRRDPNEVPAAVDVWPGSIGSTRAKAVGEAKRPQESSYQVFLIRVSKPNPPFWSRVPLMETRGVA